MDGSFVGSWAMGGVSVGGDNVKNRESILEFRGVDATGGFGLRILGRGPFGSYLICVSSRYVRSV